MRALVLIASMLLFTTQASADDLTITDYIVSHNPIVAATRNLNKGILGNAKIEGKASAFTGLVGDSTDRGAVGVTLTIPLLDQKEKAERAKGIVEKEASVREEVARLLLKLRQSQAELKALDASIKGAEEYVAWMRKRVEAGVDYQKSYYETSKALTEEKGKREKTVAEVTALTNQLLLLVDTHYRGELAAMLKEGKE